MRVSLGLGDEDWDAALASLPLAARDVYFTPSYHALHHGRWCALVEDAGERLLVPGLRTPIANGAWDLQSANGYGGPVATSTEPRFLQRAWSAFCEAAAAEGCVAAFFRLHPLLDNDPVLPPGAVVVDDRPTVVLDLTGGLDRVWARSGSRHRNMVRKGRRNGAVVEWGADMEEFGGMYDDAMTRMGAPARLRFSPDYFAALGRLPQASLAMVRERGQLVAGAVFLMGSVWAHYHLAARVPDSGNHVGCTLVQAGIERAAAAGLEALHLGGGRSADPADALLAFKRGVSIEERTFRVARVVVDPAAWQSLIGHWEASHGGTPTWLLGYRQPPPRSRA